MTFDPPGGGVRLGVGLRNHLDLLRETVSGIAACDLRRETDGEIFSVKFFQKLLRSLSSCTHRCKTL